ARAAARPARGGAAGPRAGAARAAGARAAGRPRAPQADAGHPAVAAGLLDRARAAGRVRPGPVKRGTTSRSRSRTTGSFPPLRSAARAPPAALLTTCGGDAPPRPNLLLISIDTLRADRLGCYGNEEWGRTISPHIDALAAQGAVLDAEFTARG